MKGHRLLVGIELMEVPGVIVRLAGPKPAAGASQLRIGTALPPAARMLATV
jgi:hypothetical protein